MNKIFINYAIEDIEIVNEISSRLREQGFSIWVDHNNLRVGEYWQNEIIDVIGKCTKFICIMSKKSVDKKGYVQIEINEAIKKQKLSDNNKFILPIKIEDCKSPYREIEDLHILSYHADKEKAINNLIISLNADFDLKKNYEIIGFDLGHGETAVAITNIGSSTEPQILEIIGNKNSILSAVVSAPPILYSRKVENSR